MKKIDSIGGVDGTRVRFIGGPLDDEEFRAEVTPDVVYHQEPEEKDLATFFRRDSAALPLSALPVAYTRLGEDAGVTIYEFAGSAGGLSLTSEEWEARIVDLESGPTFRHSPRGRGALSLDSL